MRRLSVVSQGGFAGFLLAFACACTGDTQPSSAIASLSPQPAREAPAPPPPQAALRQPRGLWVLAEGSQRVLERPEQLPQLIETARALEATDLFVQVYRSGRAWFASSYADATPYERAREAAGRDALEALIEAAHAAGLRVHAWVNVLSMARNRDAPLLSALGPGAALVDNQGRSILDYPDLEVPEPMRRYYRMGTPAVWLDPGAPGVAQRLEETFSELLRRYPTLDGLHLDYIRYPDVLPFIPGSRFGVGLDFGYGEATRARFRSDTGLEAPFGGSLANASRWDAWRRDRVTELVRRVRQALRVLAPGTRLSAAVWTYADRAYLSQGQDWRGWLDEGLLDFAVPMSYTLDDRLLGYHLQTFLGAPWGDRVWIGLGTWLFSRSPERALAQIESVRAAGATGEVLFSYDAIAEAPALREALIQAVRGGG